MLPRHAAGSFELKEGTGPITGMQSCGDFLEIYKVDKTFRVKSPETIDPEGTNPNAMWMTAPVDDVGSGNPIIARVFLQNCAMLNTGIFVRTIDKDEIIMSLHGCKEALVACDKICNKISVEVSNICERIGNGCIQKDNHGRGFNPFPQVENMVTDCGTFLIQANRAIKMICELPRLFLPLSNVDRNFDFLAKRIETESVEAPHLIQFLKDNADGIRHLVELRNFHEHPKIIKTIINNFTLTPDSNIQMPTWHLSGEKPRSIHEEMKEVITFLVEIAEATFIHTIMASVPNNYPYIVIKEENIDPANPILYRLTIDVG